MPVVESNITPGIVTPCGLYYPTALQVVSSVADDLLQRIAPEDPVLLDYINRIQLQLLRQSRWKFLTSPLQSFVTQLDVTDYWVGPLGQGPLNVFDTGLNLTNLGPIKTETFYDRSNFRLLKRTDEDLLSSVYAYRDGSSRHGWPKTWRNAPDTPCIINIYPAPDNQNNYQPQPEAPALSVTPGGALPARIYFIRTTFVDSLGNESSASDEARFFIPANNLLVVQPPIEVPTAASGIQYNRFNVYLFNGGNTYNVTTGQETLANQSGPLPNTAPYIEPVGGFTPNGQAFPTANSVEQLGGYLLQFRYFFSKPQVNNLSDTLLIPSDYFDVLVAGVNYLTAQFLKETDSIQYWKQEYEDGKVGMIRDSNLFPRSPEFINPDPTAPRGNDYGYETEAWIWNGLGY